LVPRRGRFDGKETLSGDGGIALLFMETTRFPRGQSDSDSGDRSRRRGKGTRRRTMRDGQRGLTTLQRSNKVWFEFRANDDAQTRGLSLAHHRSRTSRLSSFEGKYIHTQSAIRVGWDGSSSTWTHLVSRHSGGETRWTSLWTNLILTFPVNTLTRTIRISIKHSQVQLDHTISPGSTLVGVVGQFSPIRSVQSMNERSLID
jgi:hypothetical protein